MKLRYVTCSDPREHNSIKSIIDLGHLQHAEIAVQCHPSKMSDGMPRNIWFNELLYSVNQLFRFNLAIHINAEWANDICVNGKIPDTVLKWIQIEKSYNNPLIKRIQLNMPEVTARNINADKLAKIIHDFKKTEFIFQYNIRTKSAIEKMHITGVPFSILFDASGGNGVSPERWEEPPYDNHPTGYSGGLGPENVIRNINAINKIVAPETEIWIDAEGKLKTPTLFNAKPMFDTEIAKQYIRRANMWHKVR